MSPLSGQKIKKTRRLNGSFIITALVLSGLFYYFLAPSPAQALHSLSTYTKAYNGTLTAGEWNNLLYDNSGNAGYGDFVPTWLAAYMTGPLGIGTTTPASGLAVGGPIVATNFTGALTSSITAANVSSGEFGSNYGGGNFSLGVTSPGNFGIGVLLPSERLEVVGNILATLDSGGAATFVEDPTAATTTGKIQLGRTASDGYESISFDPSIGTNGRFVFTAPLQVPASSPGITFFDPSDPNNQDKQRSIEYSASTLQLQAGDAFKVNFSTNTGQPPSSKTFFQIGPNDLASQAAQGVFVGANAPGAFQGDLLHFQVGSSTRFRVTKWGDIVSGGSVMTMNGPILNTTQTWNNGTVDFTAWVMNITDQASATSSKLLDLRVGNVSKFVINKSGNVGINKEAPLTTLDVQGGISAIGTVNGTGLCISGDCKTSWPAIGEASSGWTISGQNLYKTVLNGNVGIGTTTPLFKLDVNGIVNATALYVNGTPYIGSQWVTGTGGVISYSGGNVGIGKINPGANLDVLTNINAGSSINGTSLCIAGDCKTAWSQVAGTNFWGGTKNGNIWNGDAGAGNVGIGTTAPSGSLHVSSANFPVAVIERTTSATGNIYASDRAIRTHSSGLANGAGVARYFGLSDSTGTLQHAGSFGVRWVDSTARTMLMTFNTADSGADPTGGTERMVIAGTGNVGINKTNPSVILDVVGSGNFTGTVNGTGLCIGGDCKASWPSIVEAGGGNYWTRTGANVYVSTSTDKVAIGTSTANAKLDVIGDLKIGDTTDTCNTTKAGSFRYNSTSRQTYLCDGVRWLNMRNCGTMVDDEGHTYGTVVIGGQCWMAENINIGTMLASGATEPNNSDNVIQKWCYNNQSSNCTTYGGLYNWNEAMRGSKTGGARGICPDGWHIPTDTEYNDLEKTVVGIVASPNPQYVCDFNTVNTSWYWRRCADDNGQDSGGTYGAGRSLKAIGQGNGDDLVGFGGKFSGARDTDGTFQVIDTYLYLWTSSLTDTYAWYRVLFSNYSTVDRNLDLQTYGFSVRCVKD